MSFEEFADLLRKRGYTEKEVKENFCVFYEFGVMDFLYSDCAKKYEVEHKDGEITKAVMVQYWFGTTNFKEIGSIDQLRDSL